MPRATRTNAVAAKKPKGKLYPKAEAIKKGTILTDTSKTQWRIGPSIGTGGFAEIYAACRTGNRTYDVAVKCEPHGNGPLFVEMHYYLRHAKLDDINDYKQKHSLNTLGVPHILANGSVEVNGQKQRFVVIPRYGSDIFKFYVENNNCLPEQTVYRLAIQMLDVYQFIHATGYIHGDLKAENIVIGSGKGEGGQAYLVDFGAASHYIKGDYKPDPKKMHNGTIKYTSRDAHLGVSTLRSDFEILGYNLIEWLGAELPWVQQKFLATPLKVQKAKEAFMLDVGTALKSIFPSGVPAPILKYMKYVSKLQYSESPDYKKCSKYFQSALKQLKVDNSGDLDFEIKS